MINPSTMLKTSNQAVSSAALSRNVCDESEYSAVPKPLEYDCFLDSSLGTDNPKNISQKEKKSMSLLSKLTVGGGILAGGLLLYKGGGNKVRKWFSERAEILSDKIANYAQKDSKHKSFADKTLNTVNKTLKKTSEIINGLTNITIIKDTVVLRAGESFRNFYVKAKAGITGKSIEATEKTVSKPFEAITNWFTGIVHNGLKEKQRAARESFSELTKKTQQTVETLRAQGKNKAADSLEKLFKDTGKKFNDVLSEKAASSRAEQMGQKLAESAKKSGDEVCELGSALLKNPGEFLTGKTTGKNTQIREKFGTYRTFANCTDEKILLHKRLGTLTENFDSLAERSASAENILSEISSGTSDVKTLSLVQKAKRNIHSYGLGTVEKSEVEASLRELGTYINGGQLDNESKKKMLDILDVAEKSVTQNKLSNAELMTETIKNNLGEEEAKAFETVLNKAKADIQTAAKTEEQFFEKNAEYKAGAAVTDAMGLTLPLIPAAGAVLLAKNDDERQSAVLRGGIPGVIGTATGVASTYLMLSGATGLAATLGSMFLSGKVGAAVDESLKPKNTDLV